MGVEWLRERMNYHRRKSYHRIRKSYHRRSYGEGVGREREEEGGGEEEE